MINKNTLILLSGTLILFAGCGQNQMLGNVGIPSGSQNVSTNTIGNNQQLVYLSQATLNDACDEQAKIITSANWKASGEASVHDTYKSQSFTDNTGELTLMCSEQKEGEKYIGTKITLTMNKSS